MSTPNNTNLASKQASDPKADVDDNNPSHRPWRRDPDGIDNIGRDGVLRSLNADRTVVLDVRRLSPEEIKETIAPADQAIKDALVGVDGRDVTDEAQLWAVPVVNSVADESDLNADRTAVLDVRRLSPEEVDEFAAPFDQATRDALIGVDGRNVTDEAQLWAVPIVNSVADESKIYKPAVSAEQKTASVDSQDTN